MRIHVVDRIGVWHAMETIISGLITAAAAVIVAVIGRMPVTSGARAVKVAGSRQKSEMMSWLVVSAAVVLFAALAPALIHHDLAGMAVFIIPVATLGLALASPINPLSAASITLALHAANIFLGPLSNLLHGSRYDTQIFFTPWMLAVVTGNAIVIGLICWWLRRDLPSGSVVVTPEPADSRISQLEKLGRLKADGLLTQDEFEREKRRILGEGNSP